MNDNLKKLIPIVDKFIGSDNVFTILEAGSHKCEDTIDMADMFPNSHIYTFECNKTTLPECREVIKDRKQITLTEKALNDVTGDVTFYPINKEKTKTTWADGNQGASSLFVASGMYPVELYVQDEVKVESIRGDEFCEQNNINRIDILWLDAQGAELKILKGLGKHLEDVMIIQAEVEFLPQYAGQPLCGEVMHYLEQNGFYFYGFHDKWEWSADAIFVNKSYILNK
jgi:FkbM family methyltransferase